MTSPVSVSFSSDQRLSDDGTNVSIADGEFVSCTLFIEIAAVDLVSSNHTTIVGGVRSGSAVIDWGGRVASSGTVVDWGSAIVNGGSTVQDWHSAVVHYGGAVINYSGAVVDSGLKASST